MAEIKLDKIGSVMDLIDVRDELISLKEYYEEKVHNSDDKVERYKASYTAVALAEACNVVIHYLRHPDKGEE